MTGAMRRPGPGFPVGPTVGRRAGDRRRPSWSRRPIRFVYPQGVPDHRSRRWPRCRSRSRPGSADRPVGRVRPARIRTRRHREHAGGHLAGDADHEGRGDWTTTGDLALPLLTTERELAARRCALDRCQHHLRGVLLGLRPHLAGGEDAIGAAAGPVRQVARDHRRGAGGDQGRGDIRRSGPRRDRRQRWQEAVAAALLPGPRHRHQRRRDADDRNRSRRGVRRQFRLPGRHGAGARARGLGGRHRWLSKRGDRGHHRGRLHADHRLPRTTPYGD